MMVGNYYLYLYMSCKVPSILIFDLVVEVSTGSWVKVVLKSEVLRVIAYEYLLSHQIYHIVYSKYKWSLHLWDCIYYGSETQMQPWENYSAAECPSAHLSNEISATELDKMLRKKDVERAFLGIIRLAKEESERMEALEESMTTVKPKWDQTLPSQIRAVLEEFDDVFP